MKRDVRLYLDDILDSIDKIEFYLRFADEKEFQDNVQLQDAVYRRLEIIGEAIKHIPAEVKEKNAQIPWREVAGFRDVLAHE